MEEKSEEMRCKVPLKLHFDGPAVDSHTMRVQELAPAMLALNGLIQEVNTIANNNTSNVQLYVKAFKPGSFGIELFLDTSLLSQLVDFFSGDYVTAFANVRTLVECLFEILLLKKWLGGRKPDHTKELEDNKVEIILDGKKLTVEAKTFNAYFNNPEISEYVNKVVSPLGSTGIDQVELSSANNVFRLTKAEYKSFVSSPDSQEFSENLLRNIVLQVKSPYFVENKKWKVQMGNQLIHVSIADPEFMNKVLSAEEAFTTGDVLVADVALTQTIEQNKVSNHYKVVKVIEHKKRPQQLSMPF